MLLTRDQKPDESFKDSRNYREDEKLIYLPKLNYLLKLIKNNERKTLTKYELLM